MQKASKIFSFTCVRVSVSMARTLRESIPQPWKDTFRFCAREGVSAEGHCHGKAWLRAPLPPLLDQRPALAHPGFGLDVLPQQPLLVKCVAGFARDGVDGTFVDLLLDGA